MVNAKARLYRNGGKRLFDLVSASVLLLVTAPLLIGVALAVWWSLGRPIFFSQQRPGLHGRLFSLIKFRTMLSAGGRETPESDAARLTPFGAWLRSTSLDELPELWLVLTGRMSLVGPRPLLRQYLPLYSSRQARRHEVRPGLTGLAQVTGRNSLDWPSRLELDVQYVEQMSLRLDLRILGKTVTNVLLRRGINQEGEATVKPFTGNRP